MDFAKLIELLQGYPGWFKAGVALWLVAGALLAGGLVVLRPSPKTPTPPTTGSLSVAEIVRAVNTAPPAQQGEVSRSYVGIAVEWTGYLRSAEEDLIDPKRIRVNLAVNKEDIVGNSIWFSITLDELPELKVLQRNSKLSISGRILSVIGPGLSVNVDPVEVRVLERAP